MLNPTDVTGILATQGGTALAPTAPLVAIQLQSSDTAAQPFRFVLGGGNFTGQRDTVLLWGYNIGNGSRYSTSDASINHSLESHYFDGKNHGMEWNFAVTAVDGTTSRPLAFYADRNSIPGSGMYWWFRIGRTGDSFFSVTTHDGAEGLLLVDANGVHSGVDLVLDRLDNDPAIVVANANRHLRMATGGSDRWYVLNTGQLAPVTDNATDIGGNGLRVRNVYAAGGVATRVKAGAPTDADFSNPMDGMLALNSSGSAGTRLYARLSGIWTPIA